MLQNYLMSYMFIMKPMISYRVKLGRKNNFKILLHVLFCTSRFSLYLHVVIIQNIQSNIAALENKITWDYDVVHSTTIITVPTLPCIIVIMSMDCKIKDE